MAPDLQALLRNWGLGTPSEISSPSNGTNNWVRLLGFGADRYVLRVQRTADQTKVAAEHRLLLELARRGLSFEVPAPIPATDGRTAVATPLGLVTLCRQLPGVHPARSEREMELAGRAAGELCAALADLPLELAPTDWRRPLETVRPEVTDLFGLLRRELPGAATEWLATRAPEIDLTMQELRQRLPVQIVHGDFGLSNLLVDEGRVSAVLDFEVAGIDLRFADLVTALRQPTPGQVTAFRRGYAAFTDLSADEEAALPTMFRHRAIGSAIWRVGVWQAGHATLEDVRVRLEAAYEMDRSKLQVQVSAVALSRDKPYSWRMTWLLALLGGGGLAVAGRYLWDRRAARRGDAAELEQVRKLADEDVTLLGEELTRLGARVDGQHLDGETRLEYQRGLDAYEAAQRAVGGVKSAADISAVTDALATGRYAIVCVRARVAGEPVPERRVPCFFNPQHGPSTTDVVWNQPGRGTRKVPACAQDAARLKAGDEPEVRYVVIGSRRVPYWEAGAAIAPYGRGYFAAGAGASYIALGSFDAQADPGGGAWGGGWSGGGHDGGGIGGGDGGGGGDAGGGGF
ncbi:phosphotransferase enzyme family protein [Kribbella albertanoniae]|uniref:phosphotransferase enzyme family protein n=1 Tax=Kribbella albertanoniae TaxID=1266829 RepID=UPI0014047C1E|nr:phosphotransferase [Kribbella albertanoniae]